MESSDSSDRSSSTDASRAGTRGTGTGVDAPDFGSLAWLRRASGDMHLRPWRLTPDRLAAYATGMRALASGGAAVELADPGAVLDPDRQPLLRPWEAGGASSSASVPDPASDPAHALAEALAARPPLEAVLRPHVALAEFAAAQAKLTVCVRALVLLAGDDALQINDARVQAWVDAQQPCPGAEADFGASLVTAAAGRAQIEAAFAP